MRSCCAAIVAVVTAAGCTGRSTQHTAMPVASGATPVSVGDHAAAESRRPLSADASVEQVLDALEYRAHGLRTLVADLTFSEEDPDTGEAGRWPGKVWYAASSEEGPAIRMLIERKGPSNGKDASIEYFVQGSWFTERDYARRVEVKRQIRRPGETLDPLRLEQGMFPLPIGQRRSEVLKRYSAAKVTETAGEPELTVHLRLTAIEEKAALRTVDLWVQCSTHFPVRIQTTDSRKMKRTVDLEDIRMNRAMNPSDLGLRPVSGWTKKTESLVE